MSKDINPNDVIERIRFIIDNQRISQAAFAARIGMNPANLSKHLNGRLPITSGLINRIAVDMGVSKSWLASGSGVPYPKEQETQSPGSMAGIPVYDIDVTAGSAELSRQFTSEHIIGSMNLPGVSQGCAVVRVNGDSMEPEINNGSYVAIRPISDTSCIFWGQIYVIVLDDFRMVKHLRRHPDPSMVILRSANPAYDDMEIPLHKIRKLYLVETILNLRTQC